MEWFIGFFSETPHAWSSSEDFGFFKKDYKLLSHVTVSVLKNFFFKKNFSTKDGNRYYRPDFSYPNTKYYDLALMFHKPGQYKAAYHEQLKFFTFPTLRYSLMPNFYGFSVGRVHTWREWYAHYKREVFINNRKYRNLMFYTKFLKNGCSRSVDKFETIRFKKKHQISISRLLNIKTSKYDLELFKALGHFDYNVNKMNNHSPMNSVAASPINIVRSKTEPNYSEIHRSKFKDTSFLIYLLWILKSYKEVSKLFVLHSGINDLFHYCAMLLYNLFIS